MARYISHPRIEDPIWLEPDDTSFLRARISEAEMQVESLESQISELTHRRDAKLVEIASLRNILAPVRRIPLEILSEIFSLSCIPDHGVWRDNFNLSRKMYIICGVCVAWREAAHGTPRLWSKLCLNSKQHGRALLREACYVDEWISRGLDHPLDLYLIIHSEPDITKQSLNYIPLGRIRLLNLRGKPSSYIPIFRLPPSSLPLLEDVSLDIRDNGDNTVTNLAAYLPDKIEVFSTAPKLQHVKIQFNDSSILRLLGLPMAQLTSLVITGHDLVLAPTVYIDVLRQCKNLVRLEIDMADCWHNCTGFSRDISVSFSALTSLTIPCLNVNGPVVNIPSCFITPLLGSLTLHYNGQGLPNLVVDMIDFQRRSAVTLSSLTLRSFPSYLETKHLIAMLSLYPSIKSFHIEDAEFDVTPLLRTLTCTNSSLILPKLTDFVLELRYGGETYPVELTSMVCSRWWSDESEQDVDGIRRQASSGLVRLQKVTLRRFLKDTENIAVISDLSGLEVIIE